MKGVFHSPLCYVCSTEPEFPWIESQNKTLLTLYVQLDGGVGHPHHVLSDAGQLEVVVISADVEQRQVDGVDVGPVHIGLGNDEERQTERRDGYRPCVRDSSLIAAHLHSYCRNYSICKNLTNSVNFITLMLLDLLTITECMNNGNVESVARVPGASHVNANK